MIIDTHTHFYDPSRPQGVPWPNAKDEVLYRTVLPKHFKDVAVAEGVMGTVAVEASEWVADNQWLLDLAGKDPFVVAVVGNLDPLSDGFGENLDRFARNPLFRGIRMRGKPIEGLENDALVAQLAKLAEKDLELDLLIRPELLNATASLAKRRPDLRIVINHIANTQIKGKALEPLAPDPVWVDGMRRAAEQANVYVKVSALSSATRRTPAPDDVAFYAPTLDVLWEAFGEDRLIYGSDWPVCSRYAEYPNLIRVVKEYFGAKGHDVVEKYFWKNAKAAYKWPER